MKRRSVLALVAATALPRTATANIIQQLLIGTGIVTVFSGTWSSTTALSSARGSSLGAGNAWNSAMMFGGVISGTVQKDSYTFNGTSWSATSDMPAQKFETTGSGTTSDALAALGRNVSSGATNSTYKWNGSSWSSSGNGVTAVGYNGVVGNTTAATSFGGSTDFTSNISSAATVFNGSTWSTTGSMSTARWTPAPAGTQSDALAAGGANTSFSGLSSCEKYNGSTWSSAASLTISRGFGVGVGGTDTETIVYGGGFALASTQAFDGVAWANRGNLGTARYTFSAAGRNTSSGALAVGGYNTAGTAQSSVEKYT